MEEKTKERLKKLQALAERGVGGEKETAQRKLEQLLKANSLTLDDLETEKKTTFCLVITDSTKQRYYASAYTRCWAQQSL